MLVAAYKLQPRSPTRTRPPNPAALHASLRSAVEGFKSRIEGPQRGELEAFWRRRLQDLPGRGIAVAAGSPNTLANTFVSLYVLRHSLNCTLPFMIMYWGNITSDLPTPEMIAFMEERIPGLEMVDASKLPYPPWQAPLADTPDKWNGWKLKAFVAYAAPFQEVLFLDSDAMPTLDPQSFFDHPSYRMAGSMFWPDIWCGDPGLFRALRMPSIGSERQTESGMFLVDRQRHWLALEWLWLNVNNDVTYKLAYGDKDTFRAAFFLAGRLNEFYQVPLPLGVLLHVQNGQHSIRGFLQAHPNGSAALVHRAAIPSKFDLSDSDPRLISHVTMPSCAYFQQHGWRTHIMPAENFAAGVLRSSGRGGESGANGSVAAVLAPAATAGAAAGETAAVACPFDMHTLHDAFGRCARYDYNSASGGQQLPLFEIPADSHVGRVIAESTAAFRLLRKAVAQRGATSQLFQPT